MAKMTGDKKKGKYGESQEVLARYDATKLIGLRVVVVDAAIASVDAEGNRSVELPRMRELKAACAIARCLTPIKLRGWEIRAARKIMGLTLEEMANKLDARTAPETVFRWETEKQPLGGYAEKVLRLLICEHLRKEAPGISYDGAMIAHLRVLDPWILDKAFEVPYLELRNVKVKSDGPLIEAYDTITKPCRISS